jgi:hypothetical protein
MPAIKQDAYTSGRLLWTEAKHKKATLTGLTVDNQGVSPETISLYDCFTAISGVWASGGAAQAQEDLGTTDVLSGKIRKQLTVPAGETAHLGDTDLKDLQFLGSVYVVASVTDTGCIITAQYQLR